MFPQLRVLLPAVLAHLCMCVCTCTLDSDVSWVCSCVFVCAHVFENVNIPNLVFVLVVFFALARLFVLPPSASPKGARAMSFRRGQMV